jgi:3-methylcrotonyl-CoA carboxylase alpha subunit/geranyl-CoA carboxylase alpha subunit
MGISTVAVYSDADLRSPHTRFADEAVHLGASASRDSYLRIDKVLDAARRTAADAIHPGYGFLSENADFAQACETAGIAFIGPSADVIRKMGLKGVARDIAAAAGVPVVPGYNGEVQSVESLRAQALLTGLPVLIKASAGGGGKGMRVVGDASRLDEALEGARREAESAFGDGSLLIEKYIERARHVEFQIIGDEHGNLIHLFERECSIQRRHQKIIEESPSPALTPDLRSRIGDAAIAVGRAIGYTNAGTVEFILAPSEEFHFIEVNTRLQVEHPVTEMVTGLDLVRLQIEIAEGKPLHFAQEDIGQMGHAIEARLYAEDPDNDFLPSTGVIQDWSPSHAVEGLQIDAGIESKTEIGIYYDPLLAKLIAHGVDRDTALRKLVYALRSLNVSGIQTNREFLIRLIENDEFHEGRFHTGFIDEHLYELIAHKDPEVDFACAVAAVLYRQEKRRTASEILSHIPAGYRNNPYRDPSVKLRLGGDLLDVSHRFIREGEYKVSCGERQAQVQVVSFVPDCIRLSIDGVQTSFLVNEAGEELFVHSPSGSRTLTRSPRYPRRHSASEHEAAHAPMPGQVLRILVSTGQQVAIGDPMIILEAMKMEQTIRAAMDGVVESVLVERGQVVSPGDLLVEIAAREK